jgi:two-component system response regulator HydG
MIPYLNKGQGNTLMDDIKGKDSQSKKMIYCSEAMKKLFKVVDRVASTDSSILISGKSGTGKEMIARAIHNKSYRKNKAFTVINCSCLNDNTVESELFGHEKGAFTGADRQKIGLLERADSGTLVLDEIGDLKPKTQTKLLRLLQEGEIYRVGGNVPIRLNIRVICSTNKNLAEEVIKGRFREDLYYRINTIAITMPSLSERPEELPMLLKHFLGQNIQIEKPALTALINYSWPGNVRELKNLCERLRILQDGNIIKLNHLPEEILNRKKQSSVFYDPNVTLAELNKMYILNALEHFSSKRAAAKALGITVKTLYNRLHEYGAFKNYSIHSTPIQPSIEA